MGKPAARINDTHNCPVTSPVPHIGGPIIGSGATSVWIGGQPAAVNGNACACIGAADSIITGSAGVLIEGWPAARQGDLCAHGGSITSGCTTVLIGDALPCDVDESAKAWTEPDVYEKKDKNTKKRFRKPPPAQRKKIINQAIANASELLTRKLKLLKKNDPAIMKLFKTWFGRTDEKARHIILTRMRKELKLMKCLNESYCTDILDKDDREVIFAMVIPDDWSHTIRLGNPFWEAEAVGHDSKAGILIHELSHFKDIGGTVDHDYGEEYCLSMAKNEPGKALFNADNFEYFIEA